MEKTVKVKQTIKNYIPISNYKEFLNNNYFENEVNSANPVKSYFHSNRMKIISRLVNKYYKLNNVIIDIGCGNSLWNEFKIHLIGIDISRSMLLWGLNNKFLKYGISANLEIIPIKVNSVDIIIITEVLEHILDYNAFISNLKKLLKKDGLLIFSVPKDTFFSLWKPLFKVQCLLQKYIKKNKYYFYECGHINHFSVNALRRLFNSFNFTELELFTSSGLSIIGVFKNG